MKKTGKAQQKLNKRILLSFSSIASHNISLVFIMLKGQGEGNDIMETKLKISFLTSKMAEEYIVDQFAEYIARALLTDLMFRQEIGLPNDQN